MQTSCHVLGSRVTVVTDLEGNVVRVICPYHDEATHTCTVREEALRGGPLARLLENVAEDALAVRGGRCELV